MISAAIMLFIVILVVAVLPYFMMRKRFTENMRDSFRWLLKYGRRRLPFSVTKEYGMGRGFVYCPHPFTNWALNPSYHNSLGEANHTVEGFRRTCECDSIVRMAEARTYRIACVGSSTTYGYPVARYQDTWPARLNSGLGSDRTTVFNFGVCHWTTIQSFIRCLTWFPIIKPNLVIFYQAKNDMNPLYNGAEKERKVFPDFQNIMGQYSELFNLRFPRILLRLPLFSFLEMRRLYNQHFASLYKKPRVWADPKGLERLDKELADGIVFRTEMMMNLCEMINCRFLYIPEIVRDSPYVPYLKKIYERSAGAVRMHKNAVFCDVGDSVPDSDEYFADKMHFSEKGCEVFAGRVAGEVKRLI